MRNTLSLIVPTLILFAFGAGATTQSPALEPVAPQDCDRTPALQGLPDFPIEVEWMLDPDNFDIPMPGFTITPPVRFGFDDEMQDEMQDELMEKLRAELEAELSKGIDWIPPLTETPASVQHPDGAYGTDFPSGTPSVRGAHQAGRAVGMWLTWHATGAVQSQGMYVHGKKHGAWTTWLEDGRIQSQGNYLYDRREGRWVDHYSDGTPQLIAYHTDGQLDGPFETWHANGNRHYSGTYFYGSIHGPWKGWHANGQLAASGTYHYGKLVGDWLYYDESGEPTEKTGFYVDDSKQLR